MATYNGEKYLPEQMRSLLGQTFGDFTLYIRDDCSTDSTWDIINEYVGLYPEKIIAVRNGTNSGNAKYNFMKMILSVRDDYIMLCDQDDVWEPWKIEATLEKMREMEDEHGKETPILVHTDLTVVDKILRVINPSFRVAMNVNYNRTSLRDAVIQNTITGCTVMYNKALADLMECCPEEFVMHDWYLMLVAAAFGKIGYIDRCTILYRQHGGNEIGAKDVRAFSYKLSRLFNPDEVRVAINQTYPQAASLRACFQGRLSPRQDAFLREYCAIPDKGKLSRWRSVIRMGTFKNGLGRNIAYFLFI